jgi:hypothetical protein
MLRVDLLARKLELRLDPLLMLLYLDQELKLLLLLIKKKWAAIE